MSTRSCTRFFSYPTGSNGIEPDTRWRCVVRSSADCGGVGKYPFLFQTTNAEGATLAEWSYSGPDVPAEGEIPTRLNLWLIGGEPPVGGGDVEVVLSDFTFEAAPRAALEP